MKSTHSSGRGRPAGSFSYVSVAMSDLKKVVGDSGRVTVGREYALSLGIDSMPLTALKAKEKSSVNEGTVEVRSVTGGN